MAPCISENLRLIGTPDTFVESSAMHCQLGYWITINKPHD